MKQKFNVKVAGLEINLVTEQPRESVEYIVSMIERRVREIMLVSPNCPRTECLILCAMEYCSEKLELSDRVKKLESALGIGEGEEAQSAAEKALAEELATLKDELSASKAEFADKSRAYEAEIDKLNVTIENLEEEKADRDGKALNAEALEKQYKQEIEQIKAEYEEKLALLASASEASPKPEKETKPKIRSARTPKPEEDSQISIDSDIKSSPKRPPRKGSSFDILNSDDV